MMRRRIVMSLVVAWSLVAAGCGSDGAEGRDGENGENGHDGENGQNGQNGQDGHNGASCGLAPGGEVDAEGVPSEAPLSSMVALLYCDVADTGASNIADYVKALVTRYGQNQLPADFGFPLPQANTDSLRAIRGLIPDAVVKWLDPLTWDGVITSATDADPRFGANADYIAYFGDGWNENGAAPQYSGSDTAAWVWVNHEYMSNGGGNASQRPGMVGTSGQHRTLARFLGYWGVLSAAASPNAGGWSDGDKVTYLQQGWKRQVGGSWMRIVQDPATGEWNVDRSAANLRYDATDRTLVKLVGATATADHDDAGGPLPEGVVVGIHSDCAGGVSPWGTVLTAEENAQDMYGDLETLWDSNQKLLVDTTGQNLAFDTAAAAASEWGYLASPSTKHPKDVYGYLVEMDPGAAPGEYYGKTMPGVGHQKIGDMGRARWESGTFAVGDDWKLVAGQPITIYGGNDRRSGHIYKWVSAQPYQAGMTRAQIRDLLGTGTLYVAHFADLDNATGLNLAGTTQRPTEAMRGHGRWIKLSLDSTDVAPNAAALGEPKKTVGAALADTHWNRLGGFASNNAMRLALFTASLKIGARELNRPEEMEWNPVDPSGTPRLYVTFTKHERKLALDDMGRIFDPATHATASPARGDLVGAIFAIEEAMPANPAVSTTFTFWQVWGGTSGRGLFEAANPDNLIIDADGGVWFGTDGNFLTNGPADGVYYLDLDPAHATTPTPTFGKAFRIAATPSDAEATGPVFSSGMGTMFFSVQHPGEGQVAPPAQPEVGSSWPPR